MKSIKTLLSAQYAEVVIDEVKLKFKKLSWVELKDFEEVASKLGIDGKDETDGTGEVAIDSEEVKNLPVSFCVKVINSFVETAKGNTPTAEDVKKN